MDIIELHDQILFLDKIARLYWLDGKLWVVIAGEPDVCLEGEEAHRVWKLFSEKDWRGD